MAENITGFGLKVQLVASTTFPVGITITQFADDADPFDAPSIQIADKAMGLNGDLVTWSKANPILSTLNVITGSTDDKNLAILFESNRVGRGKLGVDDSITMTAIYPDGTTKTYTEGRITDGMPGNSVSTDGRQKTKTYLFAFENTIGT
jgi:hypothetical protein